MDWTECSETFLIAPTSNSFHHGSILPRQYKALATTTLFYRSNLHQPKLVPITLSEPKYKFVRAVPPDTWTLGHIDLCFVHFMGFCLL